MTRAAQILFIALTFALGFPIAAYVVGATAEHFFGQDGDENLFCIGGRCA